MRKRTRATIGSLALAVFLTLSVGGQAQATDYWQCVPFARMISGIELFGDAWTWWRQAPGKYAQGFTPKTGAVLVFKPNGVMTKGHVAVVSQVLTDRIIQVTHANWSLIGGSRGQVEKDVTVVDVSAAGDWSLVKVWYDPSRDLGSTTYPTYGFIYQSPTGTARAAAQNTVRTMTQSAMSQLASAVPNPRGDPRQMASGPTDRIAALIASVTGGGDERQK